MSWLSQPWPARDETAPPFFAFAILLLFGAVVLIATRPARARVTPAGLRQLSVMRDGVPSASAGVALAGGLLLGAVALEGLSMLEDEELRRTMIDRSASSGSGLGFSCSSSSVGDPTDRYDSGDSTWSAFQNCSSNSCSSSSCSSSSCSSSSCSSSSCGSGCGSSCGS